jgi:SAM-dependent methyltransferase
MRTTWLGAGLFFLTLATLLLEILDARLLSVLTWYHLSFLAVSLAMLGMAAGAVFVFLHPDWFSRERAPRALATTTRWFACAVPATHVMNLSIPFLPIATGSAMEVLSITASTVVLAVPFVLSGVAVTVALTRCGGSIARLYACDLVGAAAGCALVVPLLDRTNVSSAILVAGAAAAVAAVCFSRFAGVRRPVGAGLLAIGLLAAAVINAGPFEGLQIIYPKNRQLWLLNSLNVVTRWNSHSYVLVQRPAEEPAFMWGPGIGAEAFRRRIAWLAIDGEAGTPITEWQGDRASLDWVSYDVTTLPYALRRGDVVIIGVGGGRDVLSAIWGGNPSIVGIDVNRTMIDLLQGSHRTFAGIADRPEVRLVHDDGRAHLTRSPARYDIIQMSLVDTWAATGAGAFTLSENGLYTLDAWRIFLDRLTSRGVLSVSRWFDPHNVSETSRLVGLAVASLLDRGVAQPDRHIVLAARERVATLMVAASPFTTEDQAKVEEIAARRGFDVRLAPWRPGDSGTLVGRISRSRTVEELGRATADPLYDYSPPTDARPYYFNMLRPRALFSLGELSRQGALGGNLQATLLLVTLLGIATALVTAIVLWPLVIAGRPAMPAPAFAWSMTYFAGIGFGYMLMQIGLLQRFAVYIGHPTYTLAIVLFSMLLFTGAGSLISERLRLPAGRVYRGVPAAVAAALVVTAVMLPRVLSETVASGLATRTFWVLVFAAPIATLAGMCFPVGVRLVSSHAGIVPWAWGVNGAFSVLASIAGVAVSLWLGIDTNFWIAAAIYGTLALVMRTMAQVSRG